MTWRAHRPGNASTLLPPAPRSRGGELARLCLFYAVEGAGEPVRRHLEQAGAGLISTAVGATIACTAWSFMAHQRLAFRGVTPVPDRPILAFAPFLAASFLAFTLQALSLRLIGDGALAPLAGWGFGTTVKYALVRAFIWPVARWPAAARV
jgi:putative flippase GtrA